MTAVLSCPTCAAPVAVDPARRPAAFPFCSPRCRLRDLGAWSDGRYAIPGRDIDEIGADLAGSPRIDRPAP